MIPELGHFALILSFALALLAGGNLLLPERFVFAPNMRTLTLTQGFFVIVASGSLLFAFLTDDFSVAYVAAQSSRALPWGYKATALWGAHEGSMLLWLLILALWAMVIAVIELPQRIQTTALGLYAWIFSGFALFILATSNPFLRFLPVPPMEGGDLNPLLQDPAFIIHPPVLYLGYVGLSAPFVLMLSMLIHQDWRPELLRWVRLTTLSAWSFLTLGITLGSWWAYYELGWGGWWFWDPVENASLMPWLASCALLHGLRVLEVQKTAHNWVAFMAILAFAMSLLGTFLVRSGVLTSVHAFSSDPSRGAYILIFWSLVVGFALTVLVSRAKHQVTQFNLLSKEAMLFLQSLLMLVALATVLLGTLYPIVMDALWQEKLSVGPPYFNLLIAPLFLVVLSVASFGPLMHWRKDSWQRFQKPILYVLVSLLVVTLIIWLRTSFSFYQACGLSLAVAALIMTVKGLGKIRFSRLKQPMVLAHLGVFVATIGVCLTTALEIEKDIALDVGQSVELRNYRFEVQGFYDIQGPNYEGVQSKISVFRQGKLLTTLYPEKRFYTARQMALSETAIEPGFLQDIYVALGEPLEQGWSLRIYLKPFVRWIWLGGVMMAVAGFWSVLQQRQRKKVHRAQGVQYE